MYHPVYVEIPLTKEQAGEILRVQFTKEEADLLCFLAEAYKSAATELHEAINEQVLRDSHRIHPKIRSQV